MKTIQEAVNNWLILIFLLLLSKTIDRESFLMILSGMFLVSTAVLAWLLAKKLL